MPENLIYTISIPTTTSVVGTKGGGTSNNGGVLTPVPISSLIPIQLPGLVPMIACDFNECRSITKLCPDRLKVFGNLVSGKPVSTSTYENDFSDFGFDVQISLPSAPTTVSWKIEKCTGINTWTTAATISSNLYGTYNALGSIAAHPKYTTLTINWSQVLFHLGIGIYRIKFSYNIQDRITGCFISYEFELRKFNCHLALRTVKFECILPDTIGKQDNGGYVYDLCNMNYYSSLRIGGFFGSKTVPTYNEVFNKYQTGQIQHIHNEAIRKWKFDSLKFSRQLHDRLETYMMMARSTFVSDYNQFNADYEIKQLSVARAGAYEPVDVNTSLPPTSYVTGVEFNAGIQNLIASNCCNLK